MLPRAETRAALSSCNINHGGRSTFHKWDVVRLTRFDYIIFVDADADMMAEEESSPNRVAAHAAELMPAPGSAAFPPWWQFIASADNSAPVNAGLFIVRPNISLYH